MVQYAANQEHLKGDHYFNNYDYCGNSYNNYDDHCYFNYSLIPFCVSPPYHS